jgi:hypothetical protein
LETVNKLTNRIAFQTYLLQVKLGKKAIVVFWKIQIYRKFGIKNDVDQALVYLKRYSVKLREDLKSEKVKRNKMLNEAKLTHAKWIAYKELVKVKRTKNNSLGEKLALMGVHAKHHEEKY